MNLMDNLHGPHCHQFKKIMLVQKPDPDSVVSVPSLSEASDISASNVPVDLPSDDAMAQNEDRPHSTWYQENGEVRITPKLSVRGPKWPRVFAGLSKMPTSVKFFCDHRFSPGTVQSKTLTALPSQCSQHVMSEFHFWGSPVIDPAERMDTCSSQWKPSCKQALCLECQAKTCHEVCSAELQGKRGAVRLMEVVSPPRFAPIVEAMGLEARSYDLKTGFDLSTARDRQLVEEDLVNI